ncbi:MAG: hypothetical protein WB949_17085, partial [Candidatus Acidiferrales bacterium]
LTCRRPIVGERCDASQVHEHNRGGIRGKGLSIFCKELPVKIRVRGAVDDETRADPPINFWHVQNIHVSVHDQGGTICTIERPEVEVRSIEPLKTLDTAFESADYIQDGRRRSGLSFDKCDGESAKRDPQ